MEYLQKENSLATREEVQMHIKVLENVIYVDK
jgi:hypothetical protein